MTKEEIYKKMIVDKDFCDFVNACIELKNTDETRFYRVSNLLYFYLKGDTSAEEISRHFDYILNKEYEYDD